MPSAAIANPVYYPDGRVASRGVMLSPVTQSPPAMHGAPNVQQFQAAPDKLRQSDVQGIGRSPGQTWPHMPHVQQFNFDQLGNMADHQNGAVDRPEAWGWSIPRYYEQSIHGKHVWPMPVAIADPRTRTYTSLATLPAGEIPTPVS